MTRIIHPATTVVPMAGRTPCSIQRPARGPLLDEYQGLARLVAVAAREQRSALVEAPPGASGVPDGPGAPDAPDSPPASPPACRADCRERRDLLRRLAVRTRAWCGRRGMAADAGMSTAEYAIGTVAACGFAAVLYKTVTGGAIASALTDLLDRALHAV
ncbi:DUF4244 domain-containing protein [Kitasatospora sp. NPDC006697]|uniref:DUF4244 domain-containing protein n=1 Tax=Kitasatospora sp. NPDC006697 TaxID=3364020 RepID=UPI0036A8FABB